MIDLKKMFYTGKTILLVVLCMFFLGACKTNSTAKTQNSTAQEIPENRTSVDINESSAPSTPEEASSENAEAPSSGEATSPPPSTLPSSEPVDIEKEREALRSSIESPTSELEPSPESTQEHESSATTEDNNGDDNKVIHF